MVMGRDSRSEGCGFESWHHILDGFFSHILVVKLYCLFEKTENKRKRGMGWPIFKIIALAKTHNSFNLIIHQLHVQGFIVPSSSFTKAHNKGKILR